MSELIIDVPMLPPSELNVNRRTHWALKNRKAQEYANTVKLCAINARNEWEEQHMRKWHTLPHCRLQIIVTVPLSRRGPLPDPDNMTSACKPLIDSLTARERGNGVVGAAIIEDDRIANIRWLPTLIGRGESANVRIIVGKE